MLLPEVASFSGRIRTRGFQDQINVDPRGYGTSVHVLKFTTGTYRKLALREYYTQRRCINLTSHPRIVFQ